MNESSEMLYFPLDHTVCQQTEELLIVLFHFFDWKWGSRKNNCANVNSVFLHQWLLWFRQVLCSFLKEKMKIHF